jgi:hypothetical protein
MVVRSARIAWEYETVVVTPEQDLVAILNRQGTAGWETTGVTVPTPAGTAMVLKRPR